MECGQRGVGIRLARVYDSETNICVKAFITGCACSNVLAANVFGTGTYHSVLLPQNWYWHRISRVPLACAYPHFLTLQVQFTRTGP
jgi:hypothetical protein